jgi:hypothetical protein
METNNTLTLNGRQYSIIDRNDFSTLPLAKADNNRRGIAAMLVLKGKRGAIVQAYETLEGAVIL